MTVIGIIIIVLLCFIAYSMSEAVYLLRKIKHEMMMEINRQRAWRNSQ